MYNITSTISENAETLG